MYSRLETAVLTELLADLAHAANGATPEIAATLRHPDGRACALRNTQTKVRFEIVDSDGDRHVRERASSEAYRDALADIAELEADGFAQSSNPSAAPSA